MRLSISLKKNIMETAVGRLSNKFKIKSRRDVLFFEDILANYIKECEKAGYGEDIKNAAQEWMNLAIRQMTPKIFRRAPIFLLNTVMKKVWINLGLMDDLHSVKKNDTIEIKVKNEGITTSIGKNNFTLGLFTGVLNVLFESKVDCIDYLQTKNFCKYLFRIRNEPFFISSKEKSLYNKLNYFQHDKGFRLEDAFQKKIFQLKEDNRIYFRGTIIRPAENTFFHLIGNKNLLIKNVPKISYEYFNKIIKDKTTRERKLYLFKNILEAMGWGIIKIVIDGKKISFKIKNPPYGLQLERDNWDFLISTILGFLLLLDKNFNISNVVSCYKLFIITYIS